MTTRTDVSAIEDIVVDAIKHLRAEVGEHKALATLETYVAASLRLMADSKPAKVRKHARHIWIQALLPKA